MKATKNQITELWVNDDAGNQARAEDLQYSILHYGFADDVSPRLAQAMDGWARAIPGDNARANALDAKQELGLAA